MYVGRSWQAYAEHGSIKFCVHVRCVHMCVCMCACVCAWMCWQILYIALVSTYICWFHVQVVPHAVMPFHCGCGRCDPTAVVPTVWWEGNSGPHLRGRGGHASMWKASWWTHMHYLVRTLVCVCVCVRSQLLGINTHELCADLPHLAITVLDVCTGPSG